MDKENHRGRWLAWEWNGEEVGDAFTDEIYYSYKSGYPDIDFNTGARDPDFKSKIMKGAQQIITKTKEAKEGQDLPKITWDQVDAWLSTLTERDPNFESKIKRHE